MGQSDKQKEAYEKCLKLASERGWAATYTAMREDGPCPDVDYITLCNEWKANE